MASGSPVLAGSPPQAWGQWTAVLPEQDYLPVHPHKRGDNEIGVELPGYGQRFTPTSVGTIIAANRLNRESSGSPPQAWGQLAHAKGRAAHQRFTPTSVGTISPPKPKTPLSSGSPPQAWGQSRLFLLLIRFLRFTPTSVGTMWGCRGRSGQKTVHPHKRGDNDL